MAAPLVSCSSCERDWHSATMAEGLRLVGQCPRCGGKLVFSEEPAAPADVPDQGLEPTAPHLVLGVPRR